MNLSNYQQQAQNTLQGYQQQAQKIKEDVKLASSGGVGSLVVAAKNPRATLNLYQISKRANRITNDLGNSYTKAESNIQQKTKDFMNNPSSLFQSYNQKSNNIDHSRDISNIKSDILNINKYNKKIDKLYIRNLFINFYIIYSDSWGSF